MTLYHFKSDLLICALFDAYLGFIPLSSFQNLFYLLFRHFNRNQRNKNIFIILFSLSLFHNLTLRLDMCLQIYRHIDCAFYT